MECLPEMSPRVQQATARKMECCWAYAARRYLHQIVYQWTAMEDILPRPRRLYRSPDSANARNMLLDLDIECIEVKDSLPFNTEATPIFDILNSSEYFKQPLSATTIQDFMDYAVMKGVANGIGSFFSPNIFRGSQHMEGIILSLHLMSQANGGYKPDHSKCGLFPHELSVYTEAHRLSKELGRMTKSLMLSKPCCAGCYSMVYFADRLMAGLTLDKAAQKAKCPVARLPPSSIKILKINRDLRFYMGSTEERWTPCTIPPWTPWAVAQFMLDEAEAHLAKLVEKWIEDMREEADTSAEEADVSTFETSTA